MASCDYSSLRTPMMHSGSPATVGTGASYMGEYMVTYQHIGIYGWRKRCLYLFILILMIMIILNLALTIWIIKVMDFTIHGMGSLRVTDTGLRLEGEAEFMETVYVEKIESLGSSPLTLESSSNIWLQAQNSAGNISSQLSVASDGVTVTSDKFTVQSADGTSLLTADSDGVVIGADSFTIAGTEGVKLDGPLQTEYIRSDAFNELRIESPTRALYISAGEDINLQADGGGIAMSCRSDFEISTTEGQVTLDSDYIYMPNLESSDTSSATAAPATNDVYELCVCQDGRLYLGESGLNCRGGDDLCS